MGNSKGSRMLGIQFSQAQKSEMRCTRLHSVVMEQKVEGDKARFTVTVNGAVAMDWRYPASQAKQYRQVRWYQTDPWDLSLAELRETNYGCEYLIQEGKWKGPCDPGNQYCKLHEMKAESVSEPGIASGQAGRFEFSGFFLERFRKKTLDLAQTNSSVLKIRLEFQKKWI